MKKRILPAAQYDALKAAADKNGGVGAGLMLDRKGCGICGYGLAYQAGILVPPPVADLKARYDDTNDLTDAAVLISWLYGESDRCALTFDFLRSDEAVTEVRNRDGVEGRVPFEAWAEELGLVRGAEGE